MKKVLLLVVSILIISCSPSLYQHNKSEIQKAREHWVGASVQTLITSWGPPDKKSTDGNGGEIYTYRRNNGYITWVTNFYINSNNRIYHLNAHSQ